MKSQLDNTETKITKYPHKTSLPYTRYLPSSQINVHNAVKMEPYYNNRPVSAFNEENTKSILNMLKIWKNALSVPVISISKPDTISIEKQNEQYNTI